MIEVTDRVRIDKYDERNVVIETLETVTNRKTKEEREEWKIRGYYPNVRTAIRGILSSDLLIDEKEVKTVQDYEKALERQVERLILVLDELD